MNRNTVYIRVLLVIVSLVVLLAFIDRSPRHSQSDSWLPSSFNPVGSGNMAFFETLREMHWPVERWREPLSRLADQGTGNVLIITKSVIGSKVDFTEQEVGLLDDWVRAGNTLVLLGALTDRDDTRMLLERIGFHLPPKIDAVSELFRPLSSRTEQTVTLTSSDGGPARVLVLPAKATLPLSYPPAAHVLWSSEGQPYLVDIPLGAGRVICGGTAELLSNASLRKGDNLAIVLGLLAPVGHMPPRIFFEESHHGFTAAYALGRLLNDPGVRFAAMLALLGTLAFLASSLVRFGPIIPLRRESGRSTLEFVDSIADLYLRADLRNDTIQFLFSETHQRVLNRLHLPVTASHELIASRLAQAHPHLPKWKKLAKRFDSPDYVDGLPPTGWLRVARELIEIKSAMA